MTGWVFLACLCGQPREHSDDETHWDNLRRCVRCSRSCKRSRLYLWKPFIQIYSDTPYAFVWFLYIFIICLLGFCLVFHLPPCARLPWPRHHVTSIVPFGHAILGPTLWLFNIAMENPLYMEVLMGKSSINGPFSMALLNNQRVYISCNSVTSFTCRVHKSGWTIIIH